MLAPVRTAAPTASIVTLAEAKLHCRIDSSDEDTLVEMLIKTATEYLDGYTGILGRALITQTWRQDFDAFSDAMRLPVGNLLALTSVTYYDATNALQTLPSTVYAGFSDARGAYVALKPDQVWPATYARKDAVSITYTAGYGAAADAIPTPIKQAILLMVGHWYANREAVNVAPGIVAIELPLAVQALIEPFRRIST